MFEQIKRTLGNMDGQYQAKTLVTAFISDVKEVEYSKKSGKSGQSLYLRHEETGEIAWVKFTGKGVEKNPLSKADKGTTRDFLVWPFKPQDSPKTYLYCWIQRQTSQQAPQTPHQQPNLAQGVDIQAQFIKLAERLIEAIEYVVHGNVKPAGQRELTQAEQDDDIPF